MKKFLVILVILAMAFSTVASAEWLYATNGDTHIRTYTDVNSGSLGVFHKGEKIWVFDHTYTSDGRNWCTVSYKGKVGYISDRYSSYNVSDPYNYVNIGDYIGDEETYEPAEHYAFYYQTDYEFVTVRNSIPVRAWCGSDAYILGYLGRDNCVWGSWIYVAEGQAWLEINWECTDVNGDYYYYGYIPMNNLKLTEPLFDGSYPKLSGKMKVTGGRVNVRESADIDSEDIGTIHKGDILYINYFVCVDNGDRRIWACVNDEADNYLGFVSCKYLTAAN